jgi:hypothetical protein
MRRLFSSLALTWLPVLADMTVSSFGFLMGFCHNFAEK